MIQCQIGKKGEKGKNSIVLIRGSALPGPLPSDREKKEAVL